MTSDVVVRITGQDQLSPVFQRVGQRATGAARQMDQANRTLDAIERNTRETTAALNQLVQAQTRAEQSTGRFSRTGAAFGATLSTVTALASEFARAAAEEEAVMTRLRTAVEATGTSYDTYGEAIEQVIAQGEALAFSDDQVAEALARIVTTTGDTRAALDAMGVAMDFARARGIDLTTAADLIGKALAGNTATLSRYGVVVREGATATEVLAAIQARSAGQAAAYAQTTQGELDRLRNRWDNLTETIGAHANELSVVIALLPGLQAGYTLLGGAVGGLGPKLAIAVKSSSLLGAALGPVGLALAAGAATFALFKLTQEVEDYTFAAVTAETVTNDLRNFLAAMQGVADPERMREMTEVVDRFIDLSARALQNLELIGDIEFAQTLVHMGEAFELTNDRFADMTDAERDWIDANDDAMISGEELATALFSLQSGIKMTKEEAESIDKSLQSLFSHANIDAAKVNDRLMVLFDQFEAGKITAQELVAQIAMMAQEWHKYAEGADAAATATNTAREAIEGYGKALNELLNPAATSAEVLEAIDRILVSTAPHADAFREQIVGAYRAMEAGTVTQEQFERAVLEVDAALAREEQQVAANTRAFQGYLAVQQQSAGAAIREAELAELVAIATDKTNHSLQDYLAIQQGGGQARQEAIAASSELARQLIAEEERLRANRAAAIDAAHELGVLNSVAEQFSAIVLPSRALGVSVDVAGAGEAMDAVLGLFQTIEQLGGRHGNAAQIAKNLVGDPGVYAEVDKLLAEGRISLTRYTMTVAAGERIQRRSAEIEADLSVIRAKQLPLLDKADAEYAALIDRLSHLSAEEQTVALGFMDATEAAKAQQAVALAASAAMGELGAAGKQTAEQIIQGAVAADPVLKAMLEDLGLISVGADGTVTVNFPEGESLNDLLTRVNENLNNLAIAIDLLDGKADLQITVEAQTKMSEESLKRTERKLSDIDRTTAKPEVDLNDGPFATSYDNTKDRISDLNDDSATVDIFGNSGPFWATVNGLPLGGTLGTAYVQVRALIDQNLAPYGFGMHGLTAAYAHGGTVPADATAYPRRLPAAQHGGTMALVGEVGPELVMLPGGAQVIPHGATVSRLRAGQRESGALNFYGPVTFRVEEPDVYHAIRQQARAEVRR